MAGGRPSKYRPEFCQEMIDFFEREPWEDIEETKLTAKGPVKVRRREACRFPTFERFALNIDVCRDTLSEWRTVHDEFSAAYKKCKDIQKEILIQNSLFGNYEKTYAIFLSKNVTDLRNDPLPEDEQGDLEWLE